MRLLRLMCVVLAAGASLAAPALAQEIKSQQLGLQDPAIVEVRAIWRSVMDAAAAGDLKREQELGPCLERTRWRDRNGAVRLYIDMPGSGDSAYTVRQYYDAQRRLRFIHASAGAVTGASLENRVWIGADGEVLRDEFNVEGGWTFADFGDPKFWALNPDDIAPPECQG